MGSVSPRHTTRVPESGWMFKTGAEMYACTYFFFFCMAGLCSDDKIVIEISRMLTLRQRPVVSEDDNFSIFDHGGRGWTSRWCRGTRAGGRRGRRAVRVAVWCIHRFHPTPRIRFWYWSVPILCPKRKFHHMWNTKWIGILSLDKWTWLATSKCNLQIIHDDFFLADFHLHKFTSKGSFCARCQDSKCHNRGNTR